MEMCEFILWILLDQKKKMNDWYMLNVGWGINFFQKHRWGIKLFAILHSEPWGNYDTCIQI